MQELQPRQNEQEYKAVVTVLGEDKVGIISAITNELAQLNINIEDISQTITQSFFSMFMLVDFKNMNGDFLSARENLKKLSKELCLKIDIQHYQVFTAMNRI